MDIKSLFEVKKWIRRISNQEDLDALTDGTFEAKEQEEDLQMRCSALNKGRHNRSHGGRLPAKRQRVPFTVRERASRRGKMNGKRTQDSNYTGDHSLLNVGDYPRPEGDCSQNAAGRCVLLNGESQHPLLEASPPHLGNCHKVERDPRPEWQKRSGR